MGVASLVRPCIVASTIFRSFLLSSSAAYEICIPCNLVAFVRRRRMPFRFVSYPPPRPFKLDTCSEGTTHYHLRVREYVVVVGSGPGCGHRENARSS